jgi:GNAT superfamily N-acetyltransferase
MIRVRRAIAADVDVMRAMDRICFPADAPVRIRVDRECWWIAEDDEQQPAGYAGARIWHHGDERALLLTRAGVLPGHRGLGLQRRMIRARVAYARRSGIPEVWTYTVHDNPASANSLIGAGFTTWLPAHWCGGSASAVVGGKGRVFWRKVTTSDGDRKSANHHQQD